MAISALSATGADTTAATSTKDAAGSADRFLKLLVAQMQNQDPLNPMDNAQVTSQMAQINTVNGIEKLNTSVEGLSGQFTQMQALQGASLVGRDVIVPGNLLDVDDGVAQGGFDLGSTSDTVNVQVLDANNKLLDTLELGKLGTGMHSFDWAVPSSVKDGAQLHFKVIAKAGDTDTHPTHLMRDHVDAVSTSGNSFNLELTNSGTVAYSTVKAFN